MNLTRLPDAGFCLEAQQLRHTSCGTGEGSGRVQVCPALSGGSLQTLSEAGTGSSARPRGMAQAPQGRQDVHPGPAPGQSTGRTPPSAPARCSGIRKTASLTVWLAPQATSRTTTFGTGKICPSFVFSMKMATLRGTSSQSYSIRCARAMNFPSELCPVVTRARGQERTGGRGPGAELIHCHAPPGPIQASPGPPVGGTGPLGGHGTELVGGD